MELIIIFAIASIGLLYFKDDIDVLAGDKNE